jgi:hypothetical protein
LELRDLGLPTVKLIEEPRFITLDPDHQAAYNDFHSRLEEDCIAAMKAGVPGAFSKFVPAVINYADQPHLDIRVEFSKSEEDEWAVTPSKVFPSEYYHAKERQLVADVQAE